MDGSEKRPTFTEDGLLPPGDFALTLPELAESLLVVAHPTSVPIPIGTGIGAVVW